MSYLCSYCLTRGKKDFVLNKLRSNEHVKTVTAQLEVDKLNNDEFLTCFFL